MQCSLQMHFAAAKNRETLKQTFLKDDLWRLWANIHSKRFEYFWFPLIFILHEFNQLQFYILLNARIL